MIIYSNGGTIYNISIPIFTYFIREFVHNTESNQLTKIIQILRHSLQPSGILSIANIFTNKLIVRWRISRLSLRYCFEHFSFKHCAIECRSRITFTMRQLFILSENCIYKQALTCPSSWFACCSLIRFAFSLQATQCCTLIE